MVLKQRVLLMQLQSAAIDKAIAQLELTFLL
jgi:hypothetical protein